MVVQMWKGARQVWLVSVSLGLYLGEGSDTGALAWEDFAGGKATDVRG